MARKKEIPVVEKPLGELTDELWALREEKRELAAKTKAVEDKIEVATSALIERMDANKLDRMSGKMASLSVIPSVVPNIEDWDKFLAWTIKTKNLHLLHRRIAVDGWREIAEQKGVPPPGTTAFIKRTLNMRSIT